MAKSVDSATGIFHALFGQLRQISLTLVDTMYATGQSIFFNGLAYSFIGLIAMFWLIKRLHKGGIDKEDAYQALTWIVVVTIIYVIMGNYDAYKEFLNLLDMPIKYVSAITAQAFGANEFVATFGNGLDTLNNGISAVWNNVYKYFENAGKGIFVDDPKIVIAIRTAFYMFFWGIMWLVYMVLILAITCIIIVTKFMATIILAISPIVIPCLIMNQLRPYFFSWLKLYLSYSMYAPIAMIVGNFPLVALQKIELIPPTTNKIEALIEAGSAISILFFKPIGLMIIAIIGIMILVKVPSWVNQILGTQNDDSVGLAPLKAAGAMIATGVTTAGAGLVAGAGIKGALGRGITSMLPFGQTATKVFDGIKSADTAGKSVSNAKNAVSNGKTSAQADFLK